MSDGENFSRGPFFIYKNPESVSYTISTGGGGSGCGNMKNLNAEVTYDALRNRIAELEAALRFYADPFKYTDIHGDDVQVPDFYSETDFGETARAALEGKKDD